MSDAPLSKRVSLALSLILVLCIFGVGAGAYMTWHHELSLYSSEGFGEIAGCVESANVNCDVVNTSEWSKFLGIPQFTWAIVAYLSLFMLSLYAFRDRSATWLILAIGTWCGLYSGFLAYISKVELGTWCAWCIRLYATNAAIFVLAGVAAFKAPFPKPASFGAAGGALFVSAVLAIGAQQAYHSTLLADAPELVKVDAPDQAPPGDGKDQEGTAPVLTWQVQTEDGNPATLTTSESDAWKGNRESKVAVVEFADFECGYCKRASGQLKRLHDAYKDRVVFIYKHFPMDPRCNAGVKNRKHRYACQAAAASVCMQAQGRFWSFHDLAFKNQHQLKPDDLVAYATKAGADVGQFRACMQAREGEAKVKSDADMGAALEQHGTPRIWIDGKLYRAGQSAEQMAAALEIALGTDAQKARANASEMRETQTGITPIPVDVPPMRTITIDAHTFSIDTFEAGLAEGKATVGKHQIPGTRMSWYAANDACKAAGKRLCTEREWVAACQGATPIDDDGDQAFADDLLEGTTYPYGDYHNKQRCWDAKDKTKMRPVYTGEMPGCVSKDGVYDLTGNVEEWVGSTPETAVLLGGAYDTGKDHARCFRRNTTFGPGYASKRTGFRCCQ